MDELTSQAIASALNQQWEKAIAINQEILTISDQDIDALNRLGNAFVHTGKFDKAKQIYRKILSLDKYNLIAQKNLDKLNSLPKSAKKARIISTKPFILSPNLFIEEPGRTKTIALTHIAPASIISRLSIGETVQLHPKKHSIEVRSENNIYIGALADDIAFRLLRFIKADNQYHVCIKNTTKNSISVFIKEIKRGKRLATQPSFLVSPPSETHVIHKEIKLAMEDEEPKTKSKQDQDEFEE